MKSGKLSEIPLLGWTSWLFVEAAASGVGLVRRKGNFKDTERLSKP